MIINKSITSPITNFLNETKGKPNIPNELREKIQHLIEINTKNLNLQFAIEILNLANSYPFYLPEIFTLFLEDIDEFFLLSENEIETVLSTINYWQDWKVGFKLIDKITFQTQLNPEKWLILSEFALKIGQLCYYLFKGSNYALTLIFFEKTLNFLSKASIERKDNIILSAALWFISQIEFEKGYSIKASDYILSSMYYQRDFTDEEYDKFFQTSKDKIRNSLIFSSFQAATEYFIAGKVASQSFQYELAKNFLANSYKLVNRILRILVMNENDLPILVQIKTFLLQLHSIVEKEGFQGKHSCDANILSDKNSEINDITEYVRNHISLLEDIDKKIFWLSILDQGGVSLFEYDFEERSVSSKNTLYSSFMHVISKWGQVELDSGPVKELNFLGNSFIIELQEPIEIIAVVSKAAPEFHMALKNIATSFNKEFGFLLQNNWDGNIKIFEEKSLEMVSKLKTTIENS